MEQNFTKIIKKNGEEINCEIILKYYDEKNNKNYLVYKIAENYYVAKFQDVLGCAILDTNLTEKELSDITKILDNKKRGLNYEIINQ